MMNDVLIYDFIQLAALLFIILEFVFVVGFVLVFFIVSFFVGAIFVKFWYQDDS